MNHKKKIIFTPSGQRGEFSVGTTILSAAQELGVDLDSVCGGRGICSKCQVVPSFGTFPKFGVTVNQNALSKVNAVEIRYDEKKGLREGGRLGCQAKVLSDIVIDVPEDSQLHKQVVRKDITKRSLKMNPATKLYFIEVEKPDISNPSGDAERLKKALAEQWGFKKLKLPTNLLSSIQKILRAGKWTVTCAIYIKRKNSKAHILKVWPGYFEGPLLGIALDLGSTTIAANLCNLSNGEVINSAGIMNPQIRFGEDLMSRVSYAMLNEGGTEKMTTVVREAIDNLILTISKQNQISLDQIVEMVIVANPIMHHLLLGIDPSELGQAPFALSIAGAINVDAEHLKLSLNENAKIYILPCIAGHVGADAAAVALSEAPDKEQETTLIIDVGTNAEIILGNKNQVLACSSPTGPAFEGAQISCGQRAAPGAIEKVRIHPKTRQISVKVIGSNFWSDDKQFEEAIKDIGITGICGSGIIEAIAEMRVAGILDESGLIGSAEQTSCKNCIDNGRTYSFLLYKNLDRKQDIVITNNDVRAIQLAKAALYAGAKLLMEKMEVTKIEKVVLAGAFGTHISPKHAMILGMIPDCKLEKVFAVGNAAGTGARIALLNIDSRKKIESLVLKIKKIETAMAQNFQNFFVDASNIPNSSDSYSELNKIVPLPKINFNKRTRSLRRKTTD